MQVKTDGFMQRAGSLAANVHVWALVLGVCALIFAQFAGIPRSRGLFSLIALGPVAAALITYARLAASSKADRSLAKIIVECAWVCVSFGAGFFIMLPSSYYATTVVSTTLISLAAAGLVAVGVYTLATVGRQGYSLTP